MPSPRARKLAALLQPRRQRLERMGDFAAADVDLRQALALNPDEPQVLNYLGYSLVDRGEHLDEALGMIKSRRGPPRKWCDPRQPRLGLFPPWPLR